MGQNSNPARIDSRQPRRLNAAAKGIDMQSKTSFGQNEQGSKKKDG
jgi:hypothetical protein